MIKANFNYKDKSIVEFSISGHANATNGVNKYDLVCAAVSGIVFGVLNSLSDKKNDIKIKENFILIKVKNIEDKDNQLVLNVLRISLKTVEEKNKGNMEMLINRG